MKAIVLKNKIIVYVENNLSYISLNCFNFIKYQLKVEEIIRIYNFEKRNIFLG